LSAELEVRGLRAGYGRIEALSGVDLSVGEGEIVTLIGSNGAGKSTTLRAVSGLVQPRAGEILYQGRRLNCLRPDEIVARGIAQVPEGRQVLARMTVGENLLMGAHVRRDRGAIRADLARMCERFPVLGERREQLAGTLSGGEQQMLAIARALMSRPRLLLMDEPSLGLAPLIVEEIFSIVRELREEGVTILLVEQNAALALDVAARGYVLEAGRIVISGASGELLAHPDVRRAYLG
jgi:branched-chain amino acid transport system ATP-binding protein